MGADAEQIALIERHFAVRLPEDYRRFLAGQGSMEGFVPPARDYLVLFPVGQLVDFNQAGEIQQRFPGAMAIGSDGSREMLVYDFREDPPPLVLLDITAEGWPAALYQAPSLSVLLERFPRSGRSWDHGSPAR
jgi:SMI1 / KNR4 family (SUKH-1)